MTYQTPSGDLESTLSLGEKIGKACRGGEVFELISDLGGGKTAFVRGLARGLGCKDEVSSPSFTINNTYEADKYRLEHFDFYRLDQPGVVGEQLSEDLFQPDVVVAVEWGDIAQALLPDNKITVSITTLGDDIRNFDFDFPLEEKYLFEGLS